MQVKERHFRQAVERDIISAEQADALLTFLRGQPDVGPRFDFTHLLYYFGGLLAIGAMTLFMNLGWEQFGGWGIFFISLLYAGVGLWLSGWFQNQQHAVPAGILATFVVALTPLALYGLQLAMGWWPDDTPYRDYHRYIKWHWIYLEVGTLMVGIAMAWRLRYPFMLMPVAVTLWYLSMDVALMLIESRPTWEFRGFISMWFGLVMLLIALWTDIRSRASADYAFWLYLFGLLTFWCGLTSQSSDSELNKFLYFCVNVFLIVCGGVLVRRAFVIFGGLGCSFYLGHLASYVFRDSWLFPIALTAIGLGIVWLGLLWQRHEPAITASLQRKLPSALRELLEARQAA